jgi:hypothetical protein
MLPVSLLENVLSRTRLRRFPSEFGMLPSAKGKKIDGYRAPCGDDNTPKWEKPTCEVVGTHAQSLQLVEVPEELGDGPFMKWEEGGRGGGGVLVITVYETPGRGRGGGHETRGEGGNQR